MVIQMVMQIGLKLIAQPLLFECDREDYRDGDDCVILVKSPVNVLW